MLALLIETSPARRFLSPRILVPFALYLLFAATFASFSMNNDGLIYYNFLRKFVGEDIQDAYAYQFGSALFNIPFYLGSRVVEAVTGLSAVLGAPFGHVSVVLASNVALLATLYLGWRILSDLDLPAGPAALLLTLFGTPLFYYTAFQGVYKHAVDALFFTLMAFLLLRVTERATPGLLLALGACLSFVVTIRYANVALLPGAFLPLALRRNWRGIGLLGVATIASAALLFALPPARGIPYDQRPVRGMELRVEPVAVAIPAHVASVVQYSSGITLAFTDPNTGIDLTFEQWLRNTLGVDLDLAAPLKMLFSVKRGLFLWTPLTALATFGFFLLLFRRTDQRDFLAGLAVSSGLLLLIHGLWGDFWTGGFSFSQRFLASAFPFFLLGTAEVLRRWRAIGFAILSLCATFSLVVGFTHFFGYKGVTEKDGLDTILNLYVTGERTPDGLARTAGVRALERWSLR